MSSLAEEEEIQILEKPSDPIIAVNFEDFSDPETDDENGKPSEDISITPTSISLSMDSYSTRSAEDLVHSASSGFVENSMFYTFSVLCID